MSIPQTCSGPTRPPVRAWISSMAHTKNPPEPQVGSRKDSSSAGRSAAARALSSTQRISQPGVWNSPSARRSLWGTADSYSCRKLSGRKAGTSPGGTAVSSSWSRRAVQSFSVSPSQSAKIQENQSS